MKKVINALVSIIIILGISLSAAHAWISYVEIVNPYVSQIIDPSIFRLATPDFAITRVSRRLRNPGIISSWEYRFKMENLDYPYEEPVPVKLEVEYSDGTVAISQGNRYIPGEVKFTVYTYSTGDKSRGRPIIRFFIDPYDEIWESDGMNNYWDNKNLLPRDWWCEQYSDWCDDPQFWPWPL